MPMTFTTLTGDKSVSGSIKSWQNYSKVDAEGVLEEAQAMIYARLRTREMKTSDLFPVRVGAGSLDLPDGYLEAIQLKNLTTGCRLAYRDEADVEDMRTYDDSGVLDTGDPSFYGEYDEAFQFECRTTTAWKMKALFYKQPDYLSSSNLKNFLTIRYPHMLRMACLATAARFAHDDDMFAREQKLLFNEIAEISAGDEMSRSTDVPVEDM